MGKADRNRRLRHDAHTITVGNPSAFRSIYRRAKKLGSVFAVIEERNAINARQKA